MKSALATIIIVTAILTLTAGNFAMADMASGNHPNCLAAIPGSPTCLGGMDPFQFAVTHINALLSASLGIVSSFVLVLFGALLLLVWLTLPSLSKLSASASYYLRIFTERNVRSIRKQRRWISLLEKRDPSLAFAAST